MTSNTGSSSSSQSTSSQSKVNYNTPAAILGNKITDGDEFVLITRSRQSDQPQVWSSGDPQQTQHMFRSVRDQVDTLETSG